MNIQNIKKENLVGIKKIQHYSYALTDEIGRGFSSSVYKGKDDLTNQFYAVKVVDMRKLSQQIQRQLLKSEISCLKQLKQSKNILKVIQVYATTNNTYIITQLCEGKDLAKLIRAKKQFTQKQAVSIMKQIVNGYSDIYKNGIIHRDLKPANIFFKKNIIKIADFGFAIKSTNSHQYKQYNLGSPTYMSPEALKQNIYSYKSDIWALGVILFEMLNGKVPWKTKSDLSLYKKMLDQPIQTLILPQVQISQYLIQFMKKCCNPRLENRMSPEQLIKFRWQIEDTQQIHFFNTNSPLKIKSQQTVSRPQSFLKNQTFQFPANRMSNLSNLQQKINKTVTMTSQSPKKDMRLQTQISDKKIIKQHRINKQINQRTVTQNFLKQTSQTFPPEQYQSGLVANAKNGILSQIHYCRFIYYILVDVDKLQQNRCKGDLIQYLKCQLMNKMLILMKVAKQQKNYFHLKGFEELIKSLQWNSLKDLIIKYNYKYSSKYGQLKQISIKQDIIGLAIKQYRLDVKNLDFLDKITNFYQIKQLQKKINYNDFSEKTKIQLLVDCKMPPSIQRLKNKLMLLGL